MAATIRPLRDDDLVPLEAVARRVKARDNYPVWLPDDDLLGFLTRPTALASWVAEVEGVLAGHVALHPRSSRPVMDCARAAGIGGDIGVIARLLVGPDHRRLGIAADLLAVCHREALSRGLVSILDVVSTSAGAIALYRGAGWVEIGSVTHHLPDGSTVSELVFRGPDCGPGS